MSETIPNRPLVFSSPDNTRQGSGRIVDGAKNNLGWITLPQKKTKHLWVIRDMKERRISVKILPGNILYNKGNDGKIVDDFDVIVIYC